MAAIVLVFQFLNLELQNAVHFYHSCLSAQGSWCTQAL